MFRVTPAWLFSLATVSVFAACSNGGASTSEIKTGGNFVVLSTEPSNNGQLFLNDPIRIDFSRPVELDSVDLNTFAFQVYDQLGNPVQENVAGTFRIGRSPGDTTAGRRLEFVPRFPTNDTFDNGGFKPGRRYLVQLVGGNRVNGTVIRDTTGKGLLAATSFQFVTAEGVTPAQLFRNTVPGGPRRTGLSVTPADDGTGVPLNKFGAPPVEVRLTFDQPLNPSSTNLPVALDLDPAVRSASNRGTVFLEYTDPVTGPNTWIPARVELEANALESATVLIRPVGVLPNNAEIDIVVESNMADISGESNVSNVSYDRVFGTFQTKRSYEQQFDAVIEDFDAGNNHIDLAAPFGEPVAEVGPGYVKAGFAYEGTPTNLEFEPQQDVVLNTNFTQVTPKVGVPYNVSGGVFNFKNVRIPFPVKVRGQGTNPMVWLCSGTFEVGGELSVRGGNGQRGTQIASANFPNPGGYGACGGGTGGDGSPSRTQRDEKGGTGNGPLEKALGGGQGGNLAWVAGCNRGSGGGGGSFVTQGDPNFPAKTIPPGNNNPVPIFLQQSGEGGKGCLGLAGVATRQLEGGVPGPVAFIDARSDNDFWGSAVRYNFATGGKHLRITGELSVPVGGGGGGGGGDFSYNNSSTVTDPNFFNDSTGGGGGGGGGVLIVKALGDIIVQGTGRILADGGSGGAGETNGSSNKGGGGGGGSGGMVILMSASKIVINAHGNRFIANNDYDFVISADGGVCTTSTFAAPIIQGKYPNTGTPIVTAQNTYEKNYDAAPLGGFGGMGIVQLMAPPGENADNTNTRLDDNIKVYNASGLELTGTAKTQMLAWRGFPGNAGQLVDDFGLPTNIYSGANPIGEGDIRPSPVLMPSPFARTTRVQSKWIDTGASVRRALVADDGLPRGIVEAGGALAGPTYEFAGVDQATGYAEYEPGLDPAPTKYTTVVNPEAIQAKETTTYLGKPAYRVELQNAALGTVDDVYAQYEAELLLASGTAVVGSFRIIHHTSRTLWLSTLEGALPANAERLQVKAKFFKIVTGGVEGLGSTYPGSVAGSRVPNANVRIGFAFHQNPANSSALRYPATPGTYVYDLENAATREAIRQLGAAFVQYDIVFDGMFQSNGADEPPALGPTTPRPELHFLRLPFRF